MKRASSNAAVRKPLPGRPTIHTWHVALVLLVALVCYVQTAGYGFVWDDTEQIAGNSRIRSFSQLGDAFQENFWAFYGPQAHGYCYRPLQIFAYMIGYFLGGLSPGPYHWLNIVLHVMACAHQMGNRSEAARLLREVLAQDPGSKDAARILKQLGFETTIR